MFPSLQGKAIFSFADPITSRKNPLITEAVSLKEKKNRDNAECFTVEGNVLIREAVFSGIFPKKVFFTEKAFSHNRDLICSLPETVEKIPVTDGVYEKLTSENAPEGIMGLFSFFQIEEDNFTQCLILENLQDPGNVGTVIRTAAALGVKKLFLCGCADLFNPKVVRCAMGAAFRTSVEVVGDISYAVHQVKSRGLTLYAAALDRDSVPFERGTLDKKCAVMIGNEGHGLSEKAKDLADIKTVIPMASMESLNAAVCASIFLWEMTRSGNQ